MQTHIRQQFIAVAMMASFGTAFAGSNTPPTDATSEQGAMGSQQSEAAATFSKIDTNGNGVISKQEAAANKALAKQFDALDANKDNKLVQAEFARFEEASPSQPSLPASPPQY